MTTKYVSLEEVRTLSKKLKMGDNHEIQDYVKGWNEGIRIFESFLDTLPALEIDTLQRYQEIWDVCVHPDKIMQKYKFGEYIRYDDLVNLLKNDIP